MIWLARNWLALALAGVLAGALWWLVDLVQDRAQLRANLAAARQSLAVAQLALDRAEDAARVHRAHIARAADQARQFSVIQNELATLEGRDAPLSDLLGATAGRLYRSR